MWWCSAAIRSTAIRTPVRRPRSDIPWCCWRAGRRGAADERDLELLRGLEELAHGVGRLIERRLLVGRQLDRDDLLDAAAAEDAGHADVQILVAVLAFAV